MALRRETRQAWGAKPPKNRRYDVNPRGVAIHYPGVTGTMRGLNHDQHRGLLRQWQAMHMNRGSNDLEYGSLICPCGVWMEGRTEFDNWFVRVGSNGTSAANTTHTSVQLLIGTADRITDQEIDWLAEAVAELRRHGWGPEVKGHRDFYATACPGDSIYNALPEIRRRADRDDQEDDVTPEDIEKIADAAAKKVLRGLEWPHKSGAEPTHLQGHVSRIRRFQENHHPEAADEAETEGSR